MDSKIITEDTIAKDCFIFGTGAAAEKAYFLLKQKCNFYRIIGFIDNNKEKQRKKFCSIETSGIEILSSYQKNIKIFIASIYYKEISSQLLNLGYHNFSAICVANEDIQGAITHFKAKTAQRIRARVLGFDNISEEQSKEEFENTNLDIKKIFDEYLISISENIDDVYKPGIFWDQVINDSTCDYYRSLKYKNFQRFNKLIRNFRLFARELGIIDGPDAFSIIDPEFNLIDYIENVCYGYNALIDIVEKKVLDYIDESPAGMPLTVEYKNRKISSETIRHAYYLNNIVKCNMYLKDNSDLIICELGGGIGDTARQFYNYFSKNIRVTYIILDLPEVLTISSYYLMKTFPELKIGFYSDFRNFDTIEREIIEEYDFILLPNYMIERFGKDSIDIFINTASLGEMEKNIFSNYLKQISRITSKIFYSSNHSEINFLLGNKKIEIGSPNYFEDSDNWKFLADIKRLSIFYSVFPEYRDLIFYKK